MSCLVRISVNLRWTSFLLSAFFITAAEAAPGDRIELVRDLAGRVGPVIGSGLACPDIARPRIQSVIEKFAAVIRDAASNEAQRSDLAQLFDRSVADGRGMVMSGRMDCGQADRRLADLEQSLAPSAPGPAAAAAPAAPAFAAAPALWQFGRLQRAFRRLGRSRLSSERVASPEDGAPLLENRAAELEGGTEDVRFGWPWAHAPRYSDHAGFYRKSARISYPTGEDLRLP